MQDDAAAVFRVEVADQLVMVAGELDANTSPILTAAMHAASGIDLTIDMSGVSFVDSTGLRALAIEQRRRADAHGGVRVAGNTMVRRTIELAGLSDMLHLTD